MSEKFVWRNCCNPFNKANHSSKQKGLRPVLEWMTNKLPTLPIDGKICDICRRELGKLQEFIEEEKQEVIQSGPSNEPDSTIEELDKELALSSLNESLHNLGESPVEKKRLSQKKYPKEKMKRVEKAFKRKLLYIPSEESSNEGAAEEEVIVQLKEKFKSSNNRSEKIQLLTILPKSWTNKKIEQEFGATNFMVRTAKKLVAEKGILSTPNPRPGNTLDEETANLVKSFYESDEVSRQMPGMKDFVSVKIGDRREHVQKRLLLSNLKEIYCLFKDKFPGYKIGFSKFADLRPKNCVLVDASGSHNVCVCTIHQNAKLMLQGVKIEELTKNDEAPLKTYKDCIAVAICITPTPSCYLNKCTLCPGIEKLRDRLTNLIDDQMIDTIVYKQWISVDRTNLETLSKSADEFLDVLCDKLEKLKCHSFIASQQSAFQSELKEKLKPGEFLVICDFSENYSFVLQDAAQGFHWNNAQATIHPFVAYYKEEGTVCNVSFAVISECLVHNTIAVHLFQRKLIDFLTLKFAIVPKKIYYFSDGAASQYKNRKNFVNLCFHETDFGFIAEWHYSATSHGKGASDGIGGTIKRLAARASLQRTHDNQITTPRQLYDYAKENILGISFQYCTNEDHSAEEKFLQNRFLQARTIPGTQSFHAAIPISKNKILIKHFSRSEESQEELVTKGNESQLLELSDIVGFVTCVYDGKWWPACVLSVDKSKEEVTVSFLQPHGPATSFTFPLRPDILQVPRENILTKIDPRTETGRTYLITEEEKAAATQQLEWWKNKS